MILKLVEKQVQTMEIKLNDADDIPDLLPYLAKLPRRQNTWAWSKIGTVMKAVIEDIDKEGK